MQLQKCCTKNEKRNGAKMGVERRGNGFYFYTARRENGRVVRRYWGKGGGCEVGRATAWLDYHDAQVERDRRREEAAEYAALVVPVVKVGGDVRAVSDALFLQASQVLRAAGYHQPNRGRWRKKRGASVENAEIAKQDDHAANEFDGRRTLQQIADDERHARRVHVQKVFNDLSGGVNALRVSVAAEKKAVELVQQFPGDFVGLVKTGSGLRDIIEQMKTSELHAEIIKGEVQQKREELAGPNPSAMETLLIERVVVCWLFVGYLEGRLARNAAVGSGASLKVINSLNGLLDSANRRYMAAIKTLAQVQRLQVPVNVQVNVAAAGGQQVNVSGSVSG